MCQPRVKHCTSILKGLILHVLVISGLCCFSGMFALLFLKWQKNLIFLAFYAKSGYFKCLASGSVWEVRMAVCLAVCSSSRSDRSQHLFFLFWLMKFHLTTFFSLYTTEQLILATFKLENFWIIIFQYKAHFYKDFPVVYYSIYVIFFVVVCLHKYLASANSMSCPHPNFY